MKEVPIVYGMVGALAEQDLDDAGLDHRFVDVGPELAGTVHRRGVVLAENWYVVGQDPRPDAMASKVCLGVVKVDEATPTVRSLMVDQQGLDVSAACRESQ